jgi:hypothetical protein
MKHVNRRATFLMIFFALNPLLGGYSSVPIDIPTSSAIAIKPPGKVRESMKKIVEGFATAGVGAWAGQKVEEYSCPKHFTCNGNDKKPLPGYKRINPGRNKVEWSPGSTYSDLNYEHIIAAESEGYWEAEAGYRWVSGEEEGARRADENNLKVVWIPGMENPAHENVVAAEKEGFWTTKGFYQWSSGEARNLRRSDENLQVELYIPRVLREYNLRSRLRPTSSFRNSFPDSSTPSPAPAPCYLDLSPGLDPVCKRSPTLNR